MFFKSYNTAVLKISNFINFVQFFGNFVQVSAISYKFLRLFAFFCDFEPMHHLCVRRKIKSPEVLKRSLSENDEENEVSNKATKFCFEFYNPALILLLPSKQRRWLKFALTKSCDSGSSRDMQLT